MRFNGLRGYRNLQKISVRFLLKKAVPPPPLDAAFRGAYNAPHDDLFRNHHSNYLPGALSDTSRRDNGVWTFAPPLPPEAFRL